MQRVVVLGCCGAGKSTLSRELGRRYDLAVIHLDREFWNGKEHYTEATWRKRVGELLSGDRRVVDGNSTDTLDIRMPAADTIILLDLPRWVCFGRVVARSCRHWGRERPDGPRRWKARVRFSLLRWVWQYPRAMRPGLLAAIEQYRDGRRVEILRSVAEVAAFVSSLPAGVGPLAE